MSKPSDNILRGTAVQYVRVTRPLRFELSGALYPAIESLLPFSHEFLMGPTKETRSFLQVPGAIRRRSEQNYSREQISKLIRGVVAEQRVLVRLERSVNFMPVFI